MDNYEIVTIIYFACHRHAIVQLYLKKKVSSSPLDKFLGVPLSSGITLNDFRLEWISFENQYSILIFFINVFLLFSTTYIFYFELKSCLYVLVCFLTLWFRCSANFSCEQKCTLNSKRLRATGLDSRHDSCPISMNYLCMDSLLLPLLLLETVLCKMFPLRTSLTLSLLDYEEIYIF